MSAVRPIRRFDASTFPTRIAAEADEPSGDAAASLGSDLRERGRIWAFAAEAAAQALADAGLAPHGAWAAAAGLSLATGMGTYGHAEVFAAAAAGASRDGFDGRSFAEELRRGLLPHAADRQSPGALAARLARAAGIGGPLLASMTACAGGTQAIGDAFRWVRRGEADVVLAGASDSEIYPMGLASFCLLGALSRRNDEPARASRPFDAGRDGFVLGEGAGFVVLEEREHALARGASVLAEVAGFGSACDAFRVTDPHPEGLGAVLAMRRALDDAGLSPGDVGYVNAHGTSTPGGDRVEARALGGGLRRAARRRRRQLDEVDDRAPHRGRGRRGGDRDRALAPGRPRPPDAQPGVARPRVRDRHRSRRSPARRPARGAVELLRVRRADGLPGVRAGVKIRLSPPRPVARALGRLYGALHGTLRVEGLLPDGSRVTPAAYPFGSEVFALCERDAFALGGILGRARFTTLIAPGRDGDWATEVVEALGGRVVRGATETGRRPGARSASFATCPETTDPLALVVDGPLGPSGVAKGGAVVCAARTGRPLRPLGAAARRALVVTRSWSKIWLPLPFSRVVVVVGEPLPVPAGLDRAGRERLAGELTVRLAEVRRRALAEVSKVEDVTGVPEAAA